LARRGGGHHVAPNQPMKETRLNPSQAYLITVVVYQKLKNKKSPKKRSKTLK